MMVTRKAVALGPLVLSLCLITVLASGGARADALLEMPDTTEVPEFERESLLLDMDIPSVGERSPDPSAGPRLNVREFRVQGIVEYPELGIHREEIMEKVEAIRFDMMDEGEQLESGYTLDELASLSDLIAEIEENTKGRHVGPLEVQRLVFHVREQRRERGITLGMIETVADTITRYYRERGFILAKAYIPKQRVRDGIVNLTVLVGELGDVKVINNERYDERTIQRVFDGVLNQPVKASVIEERLFFVNDLPGLTAQGYFEPGLQVGDSRMTVNVTGERWYNANLRVDNHGSESSGEYRLYGDFYWHNPLGLGDQLQLGVLNSFEPDNSVYGSIRYRVPAFFTRLTFNLGASTNDFVLGRTGSEDVDRTSVSGKSDVVDAGFEYQFKRSRVSNHSLNLTWSRIESNLSFGRGSSGGFDLDTTIDNIDLRYRFDRLDEKRRILHQGSIGLTASRLVEKSQQTGEQEENPVIAPFDYTMLAFWQFPWTELQTRVVWRTSGQYAGTSLESVNQFSLSGPQRARGFALNAFYADDGFHTGIDWIFPAFGPMRDILQPMVFADYAEGKAYGSLQNVPDIDSELSNAGVGLRINYAGQVRGSLSVASPISSSHSGLDEGDSLDEGTRVYFDLQYSF